MKELVYKRLSFMPYASARVLKVYDEGLIALISYSTVVCVIDSEGWLTCTGTYSQTTRRHINAFMREYGNGYNYYDAKRCYERKELLNIYTGELKTVNSSDTHYKREV